MIKIEVFIKDSSKIDAYGFAEKIKSDLDGNFKKITIGSVEDTNHNINCRCGDDIEIHSEESLLTDQDKFDIQQAILHFASNNYSDDLDCFTQSLCEAIKTIKAYQ